MPLAVSTAAAALPGVTVFNRDGLVAVCVGCHGAQLTGGKIPGAPPDWPAAADLTPGDGSAMARQLEAACYRVPAAWSEVQTQARLALRQAREQSRQRLQQLGERAGAVTRRASDFSMQAMQQVNSGSRQALRQAGESSRALMREIAGQGPEKTLARGFAIVRDAGSGQLLQRAAELGKQVIPESYGKKYGTDYVVLGYAPLGEAGEASLQHT